MSCDNGCYEKQVPACDDIVIDAGFTAGDSLTVSMQRPGFDLVYQRNVVVAVGDPANIIILKSTFKDGLFAAGIFFNLIAYNNTTNMPVTFVIDGKEYDCVLLRTVDINTEEETEPAE